MILIIYLLILLGAVAYIGLAVALSYYLSRRFFRKNTTKIVAFSLGLMLLYLLPTWDIFLTEWRGKEICKTEAGIIIFKAVDNIENFQYAYGRPGREMFEQYGYKFIEGTTTTGEPRKFYIDTNGNFIEEPIVEPESRYVYEVVGNTWKPVKPGVNKYENIITDKKTGERLSQLVNISWGILPSGSPEVDLFRAFLVSPFVSQGTCNKGNYKSFFVNTLRPVITPELERQRSGAEDAPVSQETRALRVLSESKQIKDELLPPNAFLKWKSSCSKKIDFESRGKNSTGTYMFLPGNQTVRKRVFLQTADNRDYAGSLVEKVICDNQSLTLLLNFYCLDGKCNHLYGTKESLEDYRTFWILRYSWSGELLSAEKFTISAESRYGQSDDPKARPYELFIVRDFYTDKPDGYVITLARMTNKLSDDEKKRGAFHKILAEYTITIRK